MAKISSSKLTKHFKWCVMCVRACVHVSVSLCLFGKWHGTEHTWINYKLKNEICRKCFKDGLSAKPAPSQHPGTFFFASMQPKKWFRSGWKPFQNEPLSQCENLHLQTNDWGHLSLWIAYAKEIESFVCLLAAIASLETNHTHTQTHVCICSLLQQLWPPSKPNTKCETISKINANTY